MQKVATNLYELWRTQRLLIERKEQRLDELYQQIDQSPQLKGKHHSEKQTLDIVAANNLHTEIATLKHLAAILYEQMASIIGASNLRRLEEWDDQETPITPIQ